MQTITNLPRSADTIKKWHVKAIKGSGKMSFVPLYTSFLLLFFSLNVFAAPTLVDKVCAIVGSERPILYSEVMKRAKEFGEKPKEAQHELIKQRALLIYAKKRVTYNAAEVREAVEAHINKIIETNRLTPESFDKILHSPTYNSSISQYRYETEYQLNKSQIDAENARTIEITPKEIELEMARRKKAPQDYSIAFITIAPPKGPAGDASLNLQFKKANSIKERIGKMKNLDEIKNNLSGQTDITVGEPMDYEKGELLGRYEDFLNENPSSRVTKPFEDNGKVVMIVKFAKKVEKKTALENARKDLYNSAVQQRHDAITNNTLANSPVTINCEW